MKERASLECDGNKVEGILRPFDDIKIFVGLIMGFEITIQSAI